jgi:hypothetical protein
MKWIRFSARLIVALWAGFWILFAVGSAIGAFLTISRPESVMLIIGLPPLVSGILFLLSSMRRQNV